MEPLLDLAPCGFVSVSDDGTMRDVNTTLATMLGYTRVELEGWHLQKILPPGGRIFYQTHVFPLLKLHGMAEEIYIPLRTREGLDVPMLMNAVRSDRHAAPSNDCVFVRMLQRHEFEDQLIQARRLAEEANGAKAKFLSMMSHDLRTPLTAITGYCSLVASGNLGPLTGDQADAMRQVRIAGDELLRMINDILGFAQLESGKVTMNPAPLPMRDAVGRATTLVRPRVEEAGLSLHAEACVEDAVAIADPDRLQQILLNLLTNATKFTPSGGSIDVACRREGERVRIQIRDTGIGIPPGQLDHIFEAFVQLNEMSSLGSAHGVGLGLAISRDLARAMDGELTAESAPGSGSVFTLDLPAAAQSVLS